MVLIVDCRLSIDDWRSQSAGSRLPIARLLVSMADRR